MNILTLSIRKKYFDEILAGTKKTETREVRPNNFKRYCRYLHKGVEYVDVNDIPDDNEDVAIVPVKYDALKLLTGEYKGKRPYMIVEVKGADTFFLTDENGEDISYEADGQIYMMTEVDYYLGNIIEKSF